MHTEASVHVRIVPSEESLSGYEVIADISNKGLCEPGKVSVIIRRPIADMVKSEADIQSALEEASNQYAAIRSILFEVEDESDAPKDGHLGYVAGVDVQKDGEIGITLIDAGTFVASEGGEDEAGA